MAAAYSVEETTQAVRRHGDPWLSLVADPAGGLLLELSRAEHQPGYTVGYTKRCESLVSATFDPALFEPPGGYERVRHRPECFVGAGR